MYISFYDYSDHKTTIVTWWSLSDVKLNRNSRKKMISIYLVSVGFGNPLQYMKF